MQQTPASSAPQLDDDERAALLEVQEELDALAQEADDAHRAHMLLCRRDVNAFCEYVLRDALTREPIEQHDIHLQMHAAIRDHDEIILMAFPESGKSTQIGVGYVLWRLGNNPNLRVAIGGAIQQQAAQTVSLIARYIESSDELHDVFPDLTPGLRMTRRNGEDRVKAERWTDTAIVVKRSVRSRDPSVQAFGRKGQGILGSRIDVLILDDLLNHENTRTPAQRDDVEKWFSNTPLSRRAARCKTIFMTNAWHPRDLAHNLERQGWKTLRFPILVRPANDNAQDVSAWPSRWPLKRIAKTRATTAPLEFARSYLCQPYDEGAQVFRPDSIKRCRQRGEGYGFVTALAQVPPGCVLVAGVDLAHGKRQRQARRSDALNVISVLLLHPNGDRQPLWIESGRWGTTELVSRLVSCFRRFPEMVYVVENNGGQQYIVELLQEHGEEVIPVVAFHTGNNKVDPHFGVASMSAEFDGGRWILPCVNEQAPVELERAIVDMLQYNPLGHTGDHLMSLWLAREGGRRFWREQDPDRQGDGGVSSMLLTAGDEEAA